MPSTTVSRLLVSALALPLLALGCASVDDEQPTQPAFAPVQPPLEDPSCGQCGKNGNIVVGSGIGQMSLEGEANDWGVKFVEFWHPSYPALDLRLEVQLDRMYVIDDDTDDLLLEGAQLVDGVMEIQLGPDTFYEVRILAVHRNWLYWTNPLQWIESYELHYDGPYPDPHTYPTTLIDQEPLCPQIADEWLGPSQIDAAVFEGEIFHQADLSIDDVPDGPGGWFTVACAHSAALKQLFTRRVQYARPFGSGIVDLTKRESMLATWTGDYCGVGESFTTTGVPLLVRDKGGIIPTDHPASWTNAQALAGEITYEAVWNENGAVCVNNWRRRQYDATNPEVHDLDSVLAAKERCAKVKHSLPPCSTLIPGFPTGWKDHGNILSAFPTANLTPPP